MPIDEGNKALFRISAPGVTRGYANRFKRSQRMAQTRLQLALHRGAERGVEVLQEHAPESNRPHKGRLKRSIMILGAPSRGGITGSARNPKVQIGVFEGQGGAQTERLFKYLAVTRRGRRGFAVKVARRGNAATRPTARELTEAGVPTGRRLGRAAALAFPGPTGRLIYRRAVGPYRPAGDWVNRAEPGVRAVAWEEMQKAERDIADFLNGFERQVRVRRL